MLVFPGPPFDCATHAKMHDAVVGSCQSDCVGEKNNLPRRSESDGATKEVFAKRKGTRGRRHRGRQEGGAEAKLNVPVKANGVAPRRGEDCSLQRGLRYLMGDSARTNFLPLSSSSLSIMTTMDWYRQRRRNRIISGGGGGRGGGSKAFPTTTRKRIQTRRIPLEVLLLVLYLSVGKGIAVGDFERVEMPPIPSDIAANPPVLDNVFASPRNPSLSPSPSASPSPTNPEKVTANFIEARSSIVGGRRADPKRYPYFCLVAQYDANHQVVSRCGGSLIRPDFVLTAAHCQHPLAVWTLVVANYTNTMNWTGYEQLQWVPPTNQFPWNDFHEVNGVMHHDVMLVQLDVPIDGIPFLKLARPSSRPAPRDVTLIGMGRTSPDGAWPTELQKLDTETVPLDRCNGRNMYDGLIDRNTMFCAGRNREVSHAIRDCQDNGRVGETLPHSAAVSHPHTRIPFAYHDNTHAIIILPSVPFRSACVPVRALVEEIPVAPSL